MADVDEAQGVRRDLRAAALGRDYLELARLVVDPSVQPQLQEAGLAVLKTAETDPVNTAPAARELATRLTDRGWPGDDELAELLLELVEGRTSGRRRIRADLEQLTELREGSEEWGGGGVLDCETGDVWPATVLEDWAGEGDAPDRRGAFSRFRRVFERHDDLRATWYAYSSEVRIGRARQWLTDQGYDALPPAR